VRSASRVGNPVYLCLITLMDQQGETPTLKHLNSYMEKLGNCICASLRRGDIYARYSIAQYILMLPGTTYENGQMVANRIDKRFRSEHPNCPLLLDISLQALDIML
ncbi:MAG: SARP family transcriptional regulator, partial [Clostridiales bacterium]